MTKRWKRVSIVLMWACLAACSNGTKEPGAASSSTNGVIDSEIPATSGMDSMGTPVGGSEEPSLTSEPIELVAADVSFLIPLRALSDFGASTVGGHGVLLPRSHFDQLEPLTRTDEPDDLYRNLDVVGVRLDPCFVEGHRTENCGSQIRLVLQPVIGSSGDFAARDATIHAFYQVPLAELDRVAQALAGLRAEEGGTATIGQHSMPTEAAAILLPSLGTARLFRITFVSVHASDEAWSFGGFDVEDGVLTHHELVGVDDHEQHLTSLGGTETLDASILPEPLIETDAARFLELYLRDEMSEEELSSAKEGVRRLLDPSVHDTGTVDCASCHMATPAAYFIEDQLGLSVPDVYANSQNQRMFGYFGLQESISPRVNAETELVLQAFERLFQ